MLSDASLILCSMLLFQEATASFLFPQKSSFASVTAGAPRFPIHAFRYNKLNAASQDTNSQDTTTQNEKPLSDLDARVLRSLLEDEDLDLKSEENLRRVLEKGSTQKQESVKEEKKESEFSSTFLQTLSDKSFWNSVKVKFDEVIESASIYVQNRVERDAKLLASIGIFAVQRALKDTGRALPASGKTGVKMAETMRKALFQLSSNSSFVEYIPKDNFVLPPSKYSSSAQTNIYEELNTPMDEIRSVTKAIKDILSGKTVSENRGLRSVAAANAGRSAERQQKAYERRKETVLRREKEGLDRKVARATSGVSDAAWELKREMEIEGNEAGYRAKIVQQRLEGTFESLGLLNESSQRGLFRGIGNRLFGPSERKVDSAQLKSATDDGPSFIESDLDNSTTSENVLVTTNEFECERNRLIESLNTCLLYPGETWLTPMTMADFQNSQDEKQISIDELENVITTMVLSRNNIETTSDDDIYLSQEEILSELKSMKAAIDQIISLAACSAGLKASEALKNILLGLNSGDGFTLLTMLDDIELALEKQKRVTKEKQTSRMNTDLNTPQADDSKDFIKNDYFFINEVPAEESRTIDSYQNVEVSVVTEDMEPATRNSNGVRNKILSDAEIISSSQLFVDDNELLDPNEDGISYSEVEVLTDDDELFEEVFLNSAKDDSVSSFAETTSNPSPLVTITLRALDVILFIVEKSITIGIPGIITATARFAERTEEINRNGLGKMGWKKINNLCSAKKRY